MPADSHAAVEVDQSLPSSSFILDNQKEWSRRQHRVWKVHKTREPGSISSPYIYRQVEKYHSHPRAADYIDGRGMANAQLLQNQTRLKALDEDPFHLSSYGIFYSLNRKKRWRIPEAMLENIEQFQKPDQNLRVSVAIQELNPLKQGRCLQVYEQPPNKLNSLNAPNIREFHSWDRDSLVERRYSKGRGALLKDVFRATTEKRKKKNKRDTHSRRCNCDVCDARINLFEKQDYQIEKDRRVHVVYTIADYKATPNQINDGFQNRYLDYRKCSAKVEDSIRKRQRKGKRKFDNVLAHDECQEYWGSSDVEFCVDGDELEETNRQKTTLVTLDEHLVQRGHQKKNSSLRRTVFERLEKPLKTINLTDSKLTTSLSSSTSTSSFEFIDVDKEMVAITLNSEQCQDIVASPAFVLLPVLPKAGFIARAKCYGRMLDDYCYSTAGDLIIIRNLESSGQERIYLNPAPICLPLVSTTSASPSTWLFKLSLPSAVFDILPRDCFVKGEVLTEQEADHLAVALALSEGQGSCLVTSTRSISPAPNFCDVCFEETSSTKSFALDGCGHAFCDACWAKHLQVAGENVPIKCMERKCPQIFPPDVSLLVRPQEFVRSYTKLLADWRRMRKDFFYCRRCKCQLFCPVHGDVEWNPRVIECGACAELHCYECHRRPHLPLNCENQALYADMLQANGDELDHMTEAIRCNSCTNLVFRSEGCNYMMCRCGHGFCYICGKSWSPNANNMHASCLYKKPPKYLLFTSRNGFTEAIVRECARIRAHRSYSSRRSLFKTMNRQGDSNDMEIEAICRKYVQLYEFIENSLVQRYLASKQAKLSQFKQRKVLLLLQKLEFCLERVTEALGLIKHDCLTVALDIAKEVVVLLNDQQ